MRDALSEVFDSGFKGRLTIISGNSPNISFGNLVARANKTGKFVHIDLKK